MLEILVFDFPFDVKNLSCCDIESQVVYIFIALHLVAIHSSLVDPVLQSASVAKISTITSCIVKSATTLQCTVDQGYYLLE